MSELYRSEFDREAEFDPFTDILFNALLGFIFMFVVSIMLINPDAKSGNIDIIAEFIVSANWPDDHPDDVDLYVEDPAGNIAWYHSKEAGLVHLDRDDRGVYRDTIVVNGTKYANPLNQETVTVRGIVPGEYVVNVFHFVANSTDAVPVSIKVEKVNPTLQVVYYGTVYLDHKGHEETAVRFSVSPEGEITDISQRQKSLAVAVRKPGAGNAPRPN